MGSIPIEATKKQHTMKEHYFVLLVPKFKVMDTKRSYADYPHHAIIYQIGPELNLVFSYCLN